MPVRVLLLSVRVNAGAHGCLEFADKDVLKWWYTQEVNVLGTVSIVQ